MLPGRTALQELAAKPCVNSEELRDSLDSDIEETKTRCLRSSIYESIRTYIKPDTKVLIDGLQTKPEMNMTTGKVLFWNKKVGRWAVQPVTGPPILLRNDNLLPLFAQQAMLELKDMISQIEYTTLDNSMALFYANMREGTWNVVGKAYQYCPFLVLSFNDNLRTMEMADRSTPRPVLVSFASLLQSSVSFTGDQQISQRIKNAIERSRTMYSRLGGDVICSEHDEKLEKEEIPTAYWFLLLISLDHEDFVGAMECIDHIIKAIVANVWPRYFLVEIFHFMAIVDFGLKHRASCKRMVELYDAYAHPLDRHRFSMGVLSLWTNEATTSKFLNVTNNGSDLCQLRDELFRHWSGFQVATYPWIACKVAEELGTKYARSEANTMQMMHQMIQDFVVIGMPEYSIDAFKEMQRPGFPHSVTVRYRKSKVSERAEKEGISN